MLQIHNLTLTSLADGRTLLADLSFALPPGRKMALIGEEGNGKSALLQAIADPASVEDWLQVTGSIDTKDERVGFLPQQIPEEHLSRSTYSLWETALGEDPDYALSAKLLSELQLAEDRIDPALPLRTLSGGEKIKFLLLCLLLQDPTVLLLDEPTNDLDLTTVLWLEDFLRRQSRPLLFVSHDEALLEACADSILHIEQVIRKTKLQVTVSSLPYAEYMEERARSIVRQTQLAEKEEAEYANKMEKYRQIYQRVEHEQNVISRSNPGGGRLLKKKMHNVKSMGRRFEREHAHAAQRPDTEDAILVRFGEPVAVPAGKTLLRLQLPTLRVGDRRLAEDVHLEIVGPQRVGIVGNNGSGKTTLLREAVRALQSGTVRFGYMPQDYADRMDQAATPVDFLRSVTEADTTRVRTWLGSLQFTAQEMLRPIATLSGGQRAKLYFAEMVLNDAELLVLDEPTRNLSPLSGPEVRAALQSYTGGILAVSHDRKFLEEVCDTVWLLDKDGLHPLDEWPLPPKR